MRNRAPRPQRAPRSRRAPRLLAPLTPAAAGGAVAAALNGVLRVAIVPLFVTPLFNEVLEKRDAAALPGVLVLAGAVALAGSAALFMQDALLGRAAANVAAAWREKLYAALLHGPAGQGSLSSGGFSSRVINDLKEVETYLRFGLGTLIAESVTLLLVLFLLVRTDAVAAAALLALALPAVLSLRWLGGRLQAVADSSMRWGEEVGGHLQEGFKHHEMVRAFHAQQFMLRRFSPANRELARAARRRALVAALQAPVTQLLIFAALGVLVVLLVGSVERGAANVGEVIAFLTLVALAATPTQLLPHGYALLRQARAAAERLSALADEAPPAAAAGKPAAQPGEGAGLEATPAASTLQWVTGRRPTLAGPPLLQLSDVTHGYRAGQRVLEEVDLKLPARGLVVVLGESGSGKTTLLRLLLRFESPAAGSITLAGAPLHSINEPGLRRLLAYVPQEHALLSGSVREALSMGRATTDAQLWNALTSVGLSDAVRALPGGLNAQLKEDGGGLSGGQRQRLATARALLQEPAALLLDEPTSNLDEATEREIVELLRRLSTERLVVAVTHRPALAEAADHVLRVVPASSAVETPTERGAKLRPSGPLPPELT